MFLSLRKDLNSPYVRKCAIAKVDVKNPYRYAVKIMKNTIYLVFAHVNTVDVSKCFNIFYLHNRHKKQGKQTKMCIW